MVDSNADQPATGSEIREILGPIDDAVIAAILRLGPTRNEVMEAFAWLSADDQIRREKHRTIHGTAAEVWRILEAELPPSGEER